MHRFAQEKNMYHVATVLVARGEMYSLRYYMTVHMKKEKCLLFVSASLTSVSLGQNELGDEGVTVISRALKESKVSKLASLDLTLNGAGSRNKIGPAGAKELAAYLAVSASLTKIK